MQRIMCLAKPSADLTTQSYILWGSWNPKQALGKLDWKSPLAESKKYVVSLMVIAKTTFKTLLRFLLLDLSEVNFMCLAPLVDDCPLNSLWWLVKYKLRFGPACFFLLHFRSCRMFGHSSVVPIFRRCIPGGEVCSDFKELFRKHC